jgi:hypothetical protein
LQGDFVLRVLADNFLSNINSPQITQIATDYRRTVFLVDIGVKNPQGFQNPEGLGMFYLG